MLRLVGATGVAQMLGVSRQRAHQMIAEGKLPEPDAFEGDRPLWEVRTIEAWLKR